MRIMKKMLMVLLAGIFCLSLAGCEPAFVGIADREGNTVTIPTMIETIGSFGASNTEILTELGLGDKIILADTYSQGIEGLDGDVTYFDMYAADLELIIAMNPTVMFITGMGKMGGDDPFKALADAGIVVIYIPASASIEDIKKDIEFIAIACGRMDRGRAIIAVMEQELEKISQKVKDLPKKTVYFELQPAPDLYSFGSGVYLNEMIELAGGENILKNMDSWVSVSEEAVLAANPDVIMTNVNFMDDPKGEILQRPGWNSINAVKSGSVFVIDANASSQPCHNIIDALKEMAEAINPGLF